jgi:hypothetical protein
VYAFSLSGTNKLDWNSVPQFNPSAVIQSPFLYVWVTTAALNTGALVFLIYNVVTFAFVIIPTPTESEPDTESTAGMAEPLLPPEAVLPTADEIQEPLPSWSVILSAAVFAASWLVFYAIIIESMTGGHFMAKYSFPIVIAFALWFALLCAVTVVISSMRVGALNSLKFYTLGWNLNQNWYLVTIRNAVVMPLAWIFIVIILSVLIFEYFEPKVSSDWTCILPTDGANPPPYSSCNIYWNSGVLAIYCIMLMYLVCIVNAVANLCIRVKLNKKK